MGMYDYIKSAVDNSEVLLEWDYSKGQVSGYILYMQYVNLVLLPHNLSCTTTTLLLLPAHRPSGEGHLRLRASQSKDAELLHRVRQDCARTGGRLGHQQGSCPGDP